MTDRFDPYHKWLGIPPAEQPPDLYRLLGVPRFEADADVISHAADQRMAHLRHFQAGPHGAESQRLLNEVAGARVVLLHAEKKASYDLELDMAEPVCGQMAVPPSAVPPPPMMPPPLRPVPFAHGPPSPTNLPPPLPPPPPPAAPLPVMDFTTGSEMDDPLDALPYHADFEVVADGPGWEPARPHGPPGAPFPLGSVTEAPSDGMTTKRRLDDLLENLGVTGTDARSVTAAKPWELGSESLVPPAMEEPEPAGASAAGPSGEVAFAHSWLDWREGLSATVTRAIWATAFTAGLFVVALSVLAATPLPTPREREWLVIHRAMSNALFEGDDFDDELYEHPDDPPTQVLTIDVKAVPDDQDLWLDHLGESEETPIERTDFGVEHAPRRDLLTQVKTSKPRDYGGRFGNRQRLGATGASEAAVALALQWLANHQLPDGGWSFDHTLAPSCRGQCGDPGTLREARNGATAMALLAFLGAGQTHWTGKYKKNVQAGLHFLIGRMSLSNQGGSFHESGGRMYSHGLAAVALAEAYGMTHDRALFEAAQAAVNYICYAQDPVGGGWRYEARQKGDTSVVGWQVMALHSARMSHLQVPPEILKKASRFLDGVQADGGAAYGYTEPGEGNATTAAGLLCRMHLGWSKEESALQRGVERIGGWGISTQGDMYYNYYATQVARHWEGDVWEQWNDQMHDWLANSQVKRGHQSGSWYFKGGDHGAERGGRHYCTVMATLMFEAYYRHVPMYHKVETDDDFDL